MYINLRYSLREQTTRQRRLTTMYLSAPYPRSVPHSHLPDLSVTGDSVPSPNEMEEKEKQYETHHSTGCREACKQLEWGGVWGFSRGTRMLVTHACAARALLLAPSRRAQCHIVVHSVTHMSTDTCKFLDHVQRKPPKSASQCTRTAGHARAS